jgi:uncharacterized protein (DUF2062 family)
MQPQVINVVNQHLFPFLLLAVTFSLPYHPHITSILIILLGLAWLLEGKLIAKLKTLFNNKLALLFISFYMLYVLAALLSEDKSISFYIIEIKLSFFVFPLIISTSSISKSLLEKVLATFVGTCFLASLASVLFVFQLHRNYGHELSSIRFDSFVRENIIELLKIHPTYFSIYLLFSIIIVCYFLKKNWNNSGNAKKIILILIIVHFIFVNILLSARMPLMAFVLLVGFACIKYVLSRKRNIVLIGVSGVLILCLSLYFYDYPFINKRFIELKETSWQAPKGNNYNSTNVRIGEMICSFELLKNNWLFGVDLGEMQKKLNMCYTSQNFSQIMVEENLNPHNQYLQTWLELGIFGLIVLIAILVIPTFIAVRENHLLYFSFIFLISFCCITESIFSVQKGTVFYSFFNSLFAFHPLITKSKLK